MRDVLGLTTMASDMLADARTGKNGRHALAAISGIGEKFTANPVTGTGSMSVPIFTSPGRSGFGPQLTLYL